MPSKVVRRSVKVRRSPIPTGRGRPIAKGFLGLLPALNDAGKRLAQSRPSRRR